MSRKFTALLAAALTLGSLALTAEAQQHRAIRLGNPATRFAKPLKKSDDLRILLRSEKMKADIAAILAEAGWPGDQADLDRAAAAAEISAVQVAPGTRLPFMASRKNKKPHALIDVLWAGKKPIDAFGFEFTSKCVRYRLVTPKACSNFWVEEIGKDTTSRGLRSEARGAAAGGERERRHERVRHAARRLHDHRQEPALGQRRGALRERQGARERQASRTAASTSRSPARGRRAPTRSRRSRAASPA